MCLLKALQPHLHYRTLRVSVNGRGFTALVADTPLKKMIGLMYRPALRGPECMLFTYGLKGRYGIWMRNMRFPIDILWVDERLAIVDMAENLQPCASLACKVYRPSAAAQHFVELPAGTIRKCSATRGQRISIPALQKKA